MVESVSNRRAEPTGIKLDDLEVSVTPPVADLDVLEPNITLVIATVVLVLCL
ncbi:hypothetical protein [Maricaulis salignorans]|uniref:Uncharacterized protein n=1 Tax=Maricaulis salignorans TaxID=144026 RepID=A0A1G9WJF7_9PROT|nr:hypothetical protein [Maricaulis salignorans]SDM84497.1 hypothetical protein SAMN04488568_12529 [Maricaulis salignorans]